MRRGSRACRAVGSARMATMAFVYAALYVLVLCAAMGRSESVEAHWLRVGRELKGETIMAPGSKAYVLSGDGLYPHEAVEIRISHQSIPPAKFSFSLKSYPDDGSVQIKRRPRKSQRLRRRLDTAIIAVPTSKTGVLLVDGKESQKTVLTVSVVPTGFRPELGPEKSVQVRYNIIMERKILNNAIPETATRMIMFLVTSLFISTIVIVPMLSASLRRGDDIIKRGDEATGSKTS